MAPFMRAWIPTVAFIIAAAHSGSMPRNAYAATNPIDGLYAEHLGEP